MLKFILMKSFFTLMACVNRIWVYTRTLKLTKVSGTYRENSIVFKEICKNWLWLIQLDRRQENYYKISYCRSIDRSFGSIEKNIVFLLFFFYMSVWKRHWSRERVNERFFSSLLFSPLLLSLHFSASKQVNAHTNTYTHREKTTMTKDLFIIIFLLLFVLLVTCRFQ